MLPNEIYYRQIKSTVKINNGHTDQDKIVPGGSVEKSVDKINDGKTDQDKSVPGIPLDASCKYTIT